MYMVSLCSAGLSLVIANVVSSSPILVTLTTVLTRPTRRNIPDDGILYISYVLCIETYF
jgi:hypothetical protein